MPRPNVPIDLSYPDTAALDVTTTDGTQIDLQAIRQAWQSAKARRGQRVDMARLGPAAHVIDAAPACSTVAQIDAIRIRTIPIICAAIQRRYGSACCDTPADPDGVDPTQGGAA